MFYGAIQKVFPYPLFALSIKRHPPCTFDFQSAKDHIPKLKKNISSKSQFLKALKGMLNMKIFIFLWYSGMQLIRGIFTVTVEDLEHQLVSSSISFNLGPILKNANVLIAVWWYNDRCALKERFATSCAMQLLFELNATRLCYALIGRISFLMEINFKYLMSFAETSPSSLIKSAIY